MEYEISIQNCRVKIGKEELPQNFVKKININLESGEEAICELVLEIPFKRETWKSSIYCK